MTGLIGMPKLKSKKLSSFFNTVRQAIFHFKPNGFDCRKADKTKKHRVVLFCFMAEVPIPDSNHPRKSAINSYIKGALDFFVWRKS